VSTNEKAGSVKKSVSTNKEGADEKSRSRGTLEQITSEDDEDEPTNSGRAARPKLFVETLVFEN
jgi:hypothetical protein